MKTLLEIVTDVCDEVGLDQPASVIDNVTDPNVRKLLRFAQKAGETISSRHEWQALAVLHTWTSIAAEIQTDAPIDQDDFDYTIYNADLWDRGNSRRWTGPLSNRSWQTVRNSVTTGNVAGYWRLVGGALHMYPAPEAGLTLDMPYISKKWAASSGGTPQTKFEADDDVPRFPDKLLIMDMIWRWKHSTGLDYAEDMSDFEREMERATARDTGTHVMITGRTGGADVPTYPNVDREVP